MSQILPLRDYQLAANNSLNKSFDGGLRRVAVVLPTGAGKTVCFAHKSDEYTANNPGKRVLILAHTDELVRQAAKKLRDVAPHLRVGIVKATQNEVAATIVVASVQSLRNAKRRNLIKNVGLVIVDEAHHVSAATYQDILRHYGCFEPNGARAAGFTATLIRSDRKSLGDTWQGVAYKKDISFMIRRGYLVAPKGKRIQVDDLDLKGVKRSGGDYQAGALGEAMDASLAPEIVAAAYVEHAKERPGILFAPTVESAYTFAEALNGEGIVTEVVHGALPANERRGILTRLESGETQVISNCMVLTEGFDSPKVSCVVIARPTKSSGLYQQMVGRGLRPDPTLPREGQDCLILDVVGASAEHGLASLVDLSEKKIILRDGQTIIEAEDELDEELASSSFPKLLHDGPVVAVDFDPLASASSRVWLKTAGGTWFLSAGTGAEAVYVFIVPASARPCECAENCDGSMLCHDSRGNERTCGDECGCDGPPPCENGEHENVPCQPCGASGKVAPDPGAYDVMWATKSGYAAVNDRRGGVTEHVAISLDLAFSWGEDVASDMGGMTGAMTLNKSASWRRTKPSDKQLDLCRSRGIEVPADASKGDISALIDAQFASKRIDPIAAWFASQNKESK